MRRRWRRGLRSWVTAALVNLAALALGVFIIDVASRSAYPPASSALALSASRPPGSAEAASRDYARPTEPTPSSPVTAPPAPSAAPKPAPAATAAPQPIQHQPVAGINQIQMNNAAVIVAVARRSGLPRRACVVAIVTALQESRLRNLANPNVPGSVALATEGTGHDHDSVGLFQQRPSQGWGSVAQLTDPATAATKFYGRLNRVPHWEAMPVGAAAQAVQRSASPTAYDKYVPLAERIVTALDT